MARPRTRRRSCQRQEAKLQGPRHGAALLARFAAPMFNRLHG